MQRVSNCLVICALFGVNTVFCQLESFKPFDCSWGYVEFATSKEGQEFVDTYRTKKEEERPKMDGLCSNILCTISWQTIRSGSVLHLKGGMHRQSVISDEVLRVGTLQGIVKLYTEVKKKEEDKRESFARTLSTWRALGGGGHVLRRELVQ